MEKGYIKLYRAIDENELLANDNTCYIVFMKLLTHADRTTGTYATGRFRLASICNLKPTTLYAALKRLESMTMIRQRSDNKMTRISICNWDKYQQPNDNGMTTLRRANDTKQEEEKEREKEYKKDTNVSLAKTPRYGKPEINELMDEWEKIVGYKIQSKVQNNRNAVSNLLKKYNSAQMIQLLRGVEVANRTQYAPKIADFIELQSKLNNLMRWGREQGVKTYDTAIID